MLPVTRKRAPNVAMVKVKWKPLKWKPLFDEDGIPSRDADDRQHFTRELAVELRKVEQKAVKILRTSWLGRLLSVKTAFRRFIFWIRVKKDR